ncbi:hypothetical protein DPMN_172604 [Dreissena polymorpha]|uniref:Uncharacterized protein n=1 Tax=Dreissena polymorpha TaxID=45954 RepID=A0A9D4IES8_DREPO|nr:hypothetical protein DPMN_172604 [Dreissena polymorpha]
MAQQRPTRIPTPHVLPRCAPGLVMGPCIVEIDHIVIREVQYKLEVIRCRNEEVIVKGNFGWVWPIWAGRPRIDRIVIREVYYQFERDAPELAIGPCIVEIDRIDIREVQYQLQVKRCRNEEVNDGRTEDGVNHNIPVFLLKAWGFQVLEVLRDA